MRPHLCFAILARLVRAVSNCNIFRGYQSVNGHKRKVHFVGVGGIGMSGLAEILLNLGYEVSGSDLYASEITERLESLGLKFIAGHDATNIGDAGILVISAAIPEDNPEVVAAQEKNVPVLHRSELLADLMRIKPNAVAVGGTHGKTTTTSMISAIMDHANIAATSIIGGILHRSGSNARWGTGEYLVAEADEHDGSFLHLHPTIAVVTNIDAEHLEYYGTLDRIKHAFTDFANSVPFYGYSILCGDDPACLSILEKVQSVYVTYGLDAGVTLQGVNIRLSANGAGEAHISQLSSLHTCVDVISHDEGLGGKGLLGTLEVNALGQHNVRNALAACAVGLCLGMRFRSIADGLRLFDGVQRRLQVRGQVNGIVIAEDYAHHPTEIASVLEAVTWVKPKRVIAVFQPHLYSRTKFFCDDFANILCKFDEAIVTAIYPAREAPMPGVEAGNIVGLARDAGCNNVKLIDDMNEVTANLVPRLLPGDLVLVLGAGDINRIVPALLTAISKQP